MDELLTETGEPKSKKWLVALLVIFVVLLLGAGGGWYYYEYMYWGADNTFARSKSEVVNLESAHTLLDVNADTDQFDVHVIFQGDVGDLSADVPKLKGDLSVEVKTEGVTMTGKGEVRLVDEELFLNVSELPALFGNFDVKNQWIRFGKDTVAGFTKTDVDKCKLDDSAQAELKKFIVEQELIIEAKKEGGEEIGGLKARKYTAKIDKSVLFAIAKKSNQLLPKDCAGDLNEDPFKDVGDINLVMWAANDFFQFKINFEVKSGDKTFPIEVSLAFSKMNQPVDVQKPDGAKNWEEVFGGALTDTFGGGITPPPPPTDIPVPPGFENVPLP